MVGFQNRAKFPAQTVAENGFLTGSISSLLDTSAKLYTAVYYDIKGRPIRVTQDDHLGGYKITVTNYTFTGKPSQVVIAHYHTKETAKLEIYKYTYDHADRLVKTTHQLGPNAPIVVLSENTYDELGRLSTKTYHQNDSLKSTYTYNIRNWLTGITGSKFTQKLFYNEQDEDNTPCYNGNISQMNWSVTSEAGLIRNYNFQYDELNRLKRAIYGESNDDPNYCPDYGVDYVYDKMGNLTLVRRYGLLNKPDDFDMIDDLFIDYNGNQLKAIDDNSAGDPLYEGAFNFVDGSSKPQEYFYDANGSLVKDLNKGITSIRYNSLNLPSQVILHMSGYIDYQYSADGVKRRKESYTKLEQVVDPIPGFQISNNLASSLAMQRDVSNLVLDSRARYKGYTCTDYCGNFIYEDGELSRILTEDGYITLNGNVSTYHYYLRDHQGNNRVVTDQYGTVEEVNHYYPYGGLFGEGVEKSKQPYKYGGKELDRMHGLDWYDFGARYLRSDVPGWTGVDPLCEKYYSMSPYIYCFGNPVRFVDPNGKEVQIPPGNGYWNWSREKQTRVERHVNATNTAAKEVFRGSEIGLGRSLYSVNAGLSLGSVKGKVEVNFGEISVKTNGNQLSMEAVAGDAEAKFSVNSASLKAEVSIAEVKTTFDSDVNMNTNFDFASANASVLVGDKVNAQIDNNTKVGANIKAGPAKVGLSVDFKAATQWLHGMMNTIVEVLTPEINVNTKQEGNRY